MGAEEHPEPELPLFDRELSWLAFNGRVLQEAADPSVPLYERLSFLAIVSSNLDEFFRVRVASLRSLLRLKPKKIGRLGLNPAEVVTSPLVRCVQTASIVCDALGLESPRQDERLRPGASADGMADLLLERADAEEMLLCGHEPDCSQVVSDFVGGGLIEMRKGSVAIVDLPVLRPNGGTLLGLHAPRVLRRLASD